MFLLFVFGSVGQGAIGARGTEAVIANVDAVGGKTLRNLKGVRGERDIEHSAAVAAEEMCVRGEVGIKVSRVGVDVELGHGTGLNEEPESVVNRGARQGGKSRVKVVVDVGHGGMGVVIQKILQYGHALVRQPYAGSCEHAYDAVVLID